MGYGLGKGPFLQDENIFVGNEVHKRVIGNIQPYILLQVILMNADRTIFLEITVFVCIAERVAAVPAFGGPVVRMGIQVHAIDLGEGDQSRLVQAFGGTLDQGIGVVVAAAVDFRDLSLHGYYLHHALSLFIDLMYGMAVGFYFFFWAMGVGVGWSLRIL